MSEWFMELVLKTSDVARHRGFESLSLRQFFNSVLSWGSTQVAVRGSPAKGVGWGNWREGSNPSFSAKIALHHQVRRYFSLDKRRRGLKGTAEQSEAKNHPVNGFLVPRAGGDTAPVPPDESLLLRQNHPHIFCG